MLFELSTLSLLRKIAESLLALALAQPFLARFGVDGTILIKIAFAQSNCECGSQSCNFPLSQTVTQLTGQYLSQTIVPFSFGVSYLSIIAIHLFLSTGSLGSLKVFTFLLALLFPLQFVTYMNHLSLVTRRMQ